MKKRSTLNFSSVLLRCFSLVTATLSGPESSGFHRTQMDQANLKVWINNDVFCPILFGLDIVLSKILSWLLHLPPNNLLAHFIPYKI